MWYFNDVCLDEGFDIGTGQSHLPTSEFSSSDQYKEGCASAMSNHTVFGHGDKVNRYDYTLPQEKKDQIVKQR